MPSSICSEPFPSDLITISISLIGAFGSPIKPKSNILSCFKYFQILMLITQGRDRTKLYLICSTFLDGLDFGLSFEKRTVVQIEATIDQ
ncbi:hypothetical protein BpHYR1_005692 [Brachionus plicatilis]|uniref:Uncharacterized protein n=1 Tax=Brachionus plicatilis TaxID=10195 RepID=A0A3M7PX20_BRAPC|nr:hypothetical protein BpHYR1_005692 [Brachionus plicatilis]